MALGAEGILFVGTRRERVYAVRDEDSDQRADRVIILAHGLRSPNGVAFHEGDLHVTVGFDWHPESGVLWFTGNGRDWMGDDRPPDELNRAPRPGPHFGFPFCHGGDIPDPELGEQRACDELTPPEVKLGPHVAALGMRFYDKDTFPEAHLVRLFIAEHGSWNRSEKIGYRVTQVEVANAEAGGYRVFAAGRLQGQGVGTAGGRAGDARRGAARLRRRRMAIYRIWYEEPYAAGGRTLYHPRAARLSSRRTRTRPRRRRAGSGAARGTPPA